MSPTLPAQNPHVLQIREEDGHTNIWGQTEALWGRKSDLQDFVSLLGVLFAVWGFLRTDDAGTRPLFAFDDISRFSLQPKIVTASKFERHLDEVVYLENLNFFDAVSLSHVKVVNCKLRPIVLANNCWQRLCMLINFKLEQWTISKFPLEQNHNTFSNKMTKSKLFIVDEKN